MLLWHPIHIRELQVNMKLWMKVLSHPGLGNSKRCIVGNSETCWTGSVPVSLFCFHLYERNFSSSVFFFPWKTEIREWIRASADLSGKACDRIWLCRGMSSCFLPPAGIVVFENLVLIRADCLQMFAGQESKRLIKNKLLTSSFSRW